MSATISGAHGAHEDIGPVSLMKTKWKRIQEMVRLVDIDGPARLYEMDVPLRTKRATPCSYVVNDSNYTSAYSDTLWFSTNHRCAVAARRIATGDLRLRQTRESQRRAAIFIPSTLTLLA